MNLFLQEEEVDSNMEKTANQWKKLGFVLKDGVIGVERTQQFGSRYTYYTENDVRPLTEEEKLQLKEKAREEIRLHRILLKAYKDYERFPEDLKVNLPLYFNEQFYKNRYLHSCDTVIGYNTGFVISFLNFLDYSEKKRKT